MLLKSFDRKEIVYKSNEILCNPNEHFNHVVVFLNSVESIEDNISPSLSFT